MHDYWSALDAAYKTSLDSFFGGLKLGPNFRLWIDPLDNEQSFREMNRMLPHSAEFRSLFADYLKSRYATSQTENGSIKLEVGKHQSMQYSYIMAQFKNPEAFQQQQQLTMLMSESSADDLFNKSLQRCENLDEIAPSLFYYSAQHKDADALHILISKGANVNANGSEALYACFESNKLEAAKILFNYGANINFLTSRIEQIQKANPNNVIDKKLTSLTENNFNFLKEIYRYCEIDDPVTAHTDKEQIKQESIYDQAAYEEFDGYDGSLE
jgi:hypothetical protein